MSLIGSVSSLFNRPLPSLESAITDPSKLAGLADASSLTGASDLNSAPKIGGLPGVGGTAPAASVSFNNVLDKFVNGVDASMKNAETEKAKVLTGESTNLHQAMIAMQEASTSFSLMVEVRNKLVDSYQELMRMQM